MFTDLLIKPLWSSYACCATVDWPSNLNGRKQTRAGIYWTAGMKSIILFVILRLDRDKRVKQKCWKNNFVDLSGRISCIAVVTVAPSSQVGVSAARPRLRQKAWVDATGQARGICSSCSTSLSQEARASTGQAGGIYRAF